MNKYRVFIFLVALTIILASVEAKKAPQRQFEQILPELMVSGLNKSLSADQMLHGAEYNLNFKTSQDDTVESVAQAYISDFISKQVLNKQQNIQFEQLSVRKGLATTTVRFKQVHKGIDVYGGQFSVSINKAGAVNFATHQVVVIDQFEQAKNIMSHEQLFEVANAYFNHQIKRSEYSTVKPVIYAVNGQFQLVYQVDYKFFNKMGYWQLLINAQTGEVIRAADQLHYETVQATIFDPDPLSSSGQTYGGGYVDGNDQNTTQLSQELKTYPIEVLNQNGVYFLKGEWAESVDVSAPNDGNFSQSSNDFRYNRGEDSFEAVNVYYHISTFLDYLNNELGLNVKPYQYNTGIKFDAHGDNGDDNSFYNSEGLLVFGEGCVDDAEDADVIIHELGHGIHDWVTQGGLSQVNGLSEGTGDYFAQSYSRSRTGFAWNSNDAEYNYMFSWDGHNACWNGRTTAYNRTYPNGLVQQIHTDGQIWSSCLMKIWDQLGHEKTDSMVVEGLSMTSSTTNQAQAAQAVLQAAGELGYGSDLSVVAGIFNGCGYAVESVNQLSVSISNQPSVPVVGAATNFSANVANGQGPYSYAWDINGDGAVDGTAQSIEATYSHAYSGAIKVDVQDASNTTRVATIDVNILGADIQLQEVVNIRENLDQVCGNGDSFIDPGERWSSLLIAENTGSKTASDAYLALGKNRSAVTSGQIDNYGNTASSCERLFIDISSTGTLHTWQPAANVTGAVAEDEGSVLISLSQSFDHYGQNVNQLKASTNGFFSTSADATGGDWDNDCPLPQAPDKDNTGARIAPMHDDLKDAMFYHQTFSSCPRAAEVGGDMACEVFLWKDADLFDTTNNVEEIDIQAILYPATSQWVYQYSGSGFDGSASTTGMQNTAASDGLSYACNTANSINTSEAVCTFNKNHQPGSSGAEFVMLESPVISLGDLLVNQSQSRNMNFAISEDATCGATFGINHQASVYDQGFNAGQNNILTHAIGNNGQCNVVTNCGVGTADEANNDIVPRRGLWWNPVRDGNGFDLYTIGANRLVYFFYTGVANGEPVWYLANDADSNYDQYYNDITKYSVPGGFGNGDVGFEIVGWSNTSFIDDSNAIQVREIGGQLSAEKQYFFQYGTNNTPNMHTGSYFTPSENGWGHSVGTLGNSRVSINYIYDQQGNPYWTIGNGPNDNSAFAVYYANTFCPSCPAVAGEYKEVGEIKLTINGQTTGTLNFYNVTDEGVSWNKTNLYIENLIPPNN